MLFNSLEYPVFLTLVVGVFFGLPQRLRPSFLLGASYYFYACWRWEYLLLILAQTEINYLCGLGIARATTRKKSRCFLIFTASVTLFILFVFKYYNFVGTSFAVIVEQMGFSYRFPVLDALLPVGISFHTFQCLSYNFDLYKGRIPVERSFSRFALYVSFFPLLVAGPIERAGNLLPQFCRECRFDIERLTSGLKLIVWGLFKKSVIADRLAEYVNQIYSNPTSHGGGTLTLATVFFSFQIYCDFSGYTDIAVGSARILGYDLMENFRLPYLARSVSEFWQRWHISLSTWFRDYLYIPLGGSRVSAARWALNIVLTFLVSGLWHGANWTFIVWGALHGGYFLGERAMSPYWRKVVQTLSIPNWLVNCLQIIGTFTLVTVAWVFFRARSVGDGLSVLHRMACSWQGNIYLGSSSVSTIFGVGLIGVLILVQLLQSAGYLPLGVNRRVNIPTPLRWVSYLGMLLGIAMLGKSGGDFIYFQF